MSSIGFGQITTDFLDPGTGSANDPCTYSSISASRFDGVAVTVQSKCKHDPLAWHAESKTSHRYDRQVGKVRFNEVERGCYPITSESAAFLCRPENGSAHHVWLRKKRDDAGHQGFLANLSIEWRRSRLPTSVLEQSIEL